jgi:hypothetical protein
VFRTIHVEIDAASWNGPVPPALAYLAGPYDLDILELMATIALVTAPVAGYGFELSTLWPSLRYAPALDSGPELRLRPEWTHLDSHQKTILSDDFGMGVPALLVKRAFDADIFATQYVIKRLLPQFAHVHAAALVPSKRGPKKAPDFLALEPQTGTIHVLECKGTQSSRRAMLDAISNSGLAQKHAIGIAGAPMGERLVGGVFLPEAHNATAPVCRFVDPEPDGSVMVRASREQFERISTDFDIAGALHLMDAPADDESVNGRTPLSSLGARIASRRAAWSVEKFAGEEFQVASRTLVFPSERLEGDMSVRGVRLQVGLSRQTVDALEGAPADTPLTERTASVPRRKTRIAHRSDRRFTEATRSGVFASAELLLP